MKNSILHQIYSEYEKTSRKQNCSSQKYLQISSYHFLHKSYIFSFIYQKLFSKNFVLIIKTLSSMKNSILHQIYSGYEKTCR